MMNTQFRRAGADEPARLRWGWWHVDCFSRAVEAEGGTWTGAFDPGYVFTQAHCFTDPADGEVLEIRPGDTFSWWWGR